MNVNAHVPVQTRVIGKLKKCLPIVATCLLPMLAYSDSELPTDFVPRPSEPDIEPLLSILRSTPENGWASAIFMATPQ